MNEFPVISDDPDAQAHYEACRRAGTGHRMAEMLALRKPPGGTSPDRTLLVGRGTLAEQFEGSEQLNKVTSIARKHGYTPRYTDTYEPSLAAYPGDPAGFVPSSDPAGHIRKVCKRRNWSCDGAVKIKSVPEPAGAAP